jgi:hypothetical protein
VAYILLAMAGLIPAVWTLLRRRDASLVATFFVASAVIDLADWIGDSILQLYKYHPGLTPDPGTDDAFGVIMAELCFGASLALLMTAYLPGWRGLALGSAIVTGLEVVFVRYDLLEHYGWHLWFTPVGFAGYFWLIQTFRKNACRKGLSGGWTLAATRACVAWFVGEYYALTERIGKTVKMPLHVLAGQAENQSLARIIWTALVTLPLGWWVLSGGRERRRERLIIATLISLGLNWLGASLQIRIFRAPWGPASDAALQGLLLVVAGLIDDWIARWSQENRVRRQNP